MKLVGYCRVSSEHQKENTSLEWQRERLEAYAKIHDHELIWLYVDVETASGAKERPSFQRALKALEKNAADGLICAKLDRFARDLIEGVMVAQRLHMWKKQLIIIDMSLDTSTPVGECMFSVMLAFAQFERKTIYQRTIAGREKVKERNGYLGGGPKYGWKAGYVGKHKALIEDPEEQHWLAFMRDLRAQGLTFEKIALKLNSAGSKSKYGRPWQGSTVQNTLTDRGRTNEQSSNYTGAIETA